MKDLNCKECNKSTPYYNRKFCSWNCYCIDQHKNKKGHKIIETRNCLLCKKEFGVSNKYSLIKRQKHVFCSTVCFLNSSKAHRYENGEKNPSWRGGVSEPNEIIRNSARYKEWRNAVFERDNWTCVHCGLRSKAKKRLEIQADHIKPFALFLELRFELSNGRTLCKLCHYKTETHGAKRDKLEALYGYQY